MTRYYNAEENKVYYEGRSMTRQTDKGLFSGIPTEQQLREWGYEPHPEPEPIEPTPISQEERYIYRVRELIREKYAIEDELAIQRQRDTDPDKFNEYNDFCEACKAKAREEIYNVQSTPDTTEASASEINHNS